MTPQQYAPLIGILIALPLILLRNQRPRTLRPEWMWVLPVIIVAAMGFAVWGTSLKPGVTHAPFDAIAWVIVAVGFLLGLTAGWWRGRMTTIEKAPDGVLKAKASPIGLILIIVLLFGRRALGALIEPHAAAWGLNADAVADAFLVFVVGMIVMQRIEMFIRARRVLAGGTDAHVETVA